MRDPTDPGWPERGERTEVEEIAERWKWAYLSLVRGEHRKRVLDLGPDPVPLGEAVEAYLEHRRAMVERATWSNDRTATGHLTDAVGPGTLTTKVRTRDIQKMFDAMLRRGYRRTTLHCYLKSLRPFFDWLGGPNPCEDVSLPRPVDRDVRTWSPPEIEKLRDAADAVDEQRIGNFASCRLALEVGLCMGLRQGEVFGLRWEDIRPGRRTARIRYQVPKDRTTLRHLKGKRARTVLIHPDWWGHHEAAIGLVCGRGNGDPVGTRTQRNMITRVLDTAGLNEMGVGWHSLRHTYARRYLEGEGGFEPGSLEELQRYLGHSSITTTQGKYGHFREDAAVRLGRERFYR